jgi:hypothetical protein
LHTLFRSKAHTFLLGINEILQQKSVGDTLIEFLSAHMIFVGSTKRPHPPMFDNVIFSYKKIRPVCSMDLSLTYPTPFSTLVHVTFPDVNIVYLCKNLI